MPGDSAMSGSVQSPKDATDGIAFVEIRAVSVNDAEHLTPRGAFGVKSRARHR